MAIATIYLEAQGATVKFERRGINLPQILLKSLPIDLILMDLMLPKKVQGFDLVDQVRQIPELAAIPIVVVSAADPDVAMPLARQKGLAGFISKPITPHVVNHLADVLNGNQVWIADNGLMFF